MALAALARWADTGVADLQTTLSSLLQEGLRLGEIAPEIATAVAIILEAPDEELAAEMLTASQGLNPAVIEELANDCLLHASKESRLVLARRILADVDSRVSASSPLVAQLRATAEFLERLPKADDLGAAPGRTGATRGAADYLKQLNELAGWRFTTPEAIGRALEILKAADTFRWAEALIEMGRRTAVADRVEYLNALTDLDARALWEPDRARAILSALDEWNGAPAVEQWRTRRLPEVIVRRFPHITRGMKEGYSTLRDLLSAAHGSPADRLRIMTEGIESSGLLLGSRDLYGVAEIVAGDMLPSEATVVFTWLIERLARRLPTDPHLTISANEVPASVTDATARFLFALLSDIDTRVRWRTAHALRRLARLGATDALNAAIANWNRAEDSVFRDPEAPYYWLAARLWLVIVMDRIAGETPAAIATHAGVLAHMATDTELPHLLIREYAKRAVLRLVETRHVSATDVDLDAISLVNKPRLPLIRLKRPHRRTGPRAEMGEPTFHFDSTDTVPYWYEPLVRYFPGLQMNQFLNRAEHWILGQWKARPDANWWDLEPRKARYDERRYSLWDHRHGSMPIVERHGTYLEWHAMMCVAGELLESRALAKSDEASQTFDDWLARFLQTEPHCWLSDHREPVPLEVRLWAQDSRPEGEWLRDARADEFIPELGIGKDGRR